MSKRLADPKSVEASDECPHRDRRDGANTALFQKLFHDGIVGGARLHFLRDILDFFVGVGNGVVMIL